MNLGIEKTEEAVTVRKCGYRVVLVAVVAVAGRSRDGRVSSK